MSEKWNEAVIQSYIDGKIEESGGLEYKAAGALGTQNDKTEEITKDVSSFANAAGGIIIYGIREFKEDAKKHLPEKIDPIDRREFSKEWLEHIIGTIQPRPKFTVQPVQLSSAIHDAVYVVEIPQSDTAHQARDGRYYQRQNFERIILRDFQIRDVMRRKTTPTVKTEIHISLGKHGWHNQVSWTVKNESDVFAHHIGVLITVLVCLSDRYITFSQGILRMDDEFAEWQLSASNHQAMPLFPRSQITGKILFALTKEMVDESGQPLRSRQDVIKCRTFADAMTPEEGSFNPKSITTHLTYDISDGKIIP